MTISKRDRTVLSAPPPNATHEEYEQWRADCERFAQQQMRDMDVARTNAAREMFTSRANLESAIKRDIFPAIVSIEMTSGRTGMGFFQYGQWLVSNAHVIRHAVDLMLGVRLKDANGNQIMLAADQTYHRPYTQDAVPDLVICKTDSRIDNKYNGLPTRFPDDASYPQTIYFYIDNDFNIRFLTLRNTRSLPLLFATEDGHAPRSGCSGTPIIAANVIIAREPQWVFKTIGALYARCSAPDNPMNKLVCAIPPDEDLRQILEILNHQDSSRRGMMMASACMSIGDGNKKAHYEMESEQDRALARTNLRRFEAGDSPLEIDLPEGLEKLAGNDVVCISKSYLPLTPTRRLETFHQFILHINTTKVITLGDKDELLVHKYWRVDCAPGHGGKYWVLQLQDNIRGKIGEKSASSVFAQVKIPIHIIHVKGDILAKALECSQQNAQSLDEFASRLVHTKGKHKANYKAEKDVTPSTIVIGETQGYEDIHRIAFEEPRPNTPKTLRLFTHLDATYDSKVFENTLNKLPKNDGIDRINAQDEAGNTPLMLLLQDANIQQNFQQLSKAKLLVHHGALWHKPNQAGVHAENLLTQHPAVEEISYLKSSTT